MFILQSSSTQPHMYVVRELKKKNTIFHSFQSSYCSAMISFSTYSKMFSKVQEGQDHKCIQQDKKTSSSLTQLFSQLFLRVK